MPTHRLFQNPNGSFTIENTVINQTMHSRVGPEVEATLLYIKQSRLRERLQTQDIVLYDVGMGAAVNSFAALQAARVSGSKKLHIISFENDLTGFELALKNPTHFPFFDSEVANILLKNGEWRSENIFWELRSGDFLKQIRATDYPDLVYFDFYSPKTCPELWSIETFSAIPKKNTFLCTYSASTKIRIALLFAGFYVGYGQTTSAKTDTTVATTRLADLDCPLDASWLARVARSHDPLPFDFYDKTACLKALTMHPQFHSVT